MLSHEVFECCSHFSSFPEHVDDIMDCRWLEYIETLVYRSRLSVISVCSDPEELASRINDKNTINERKRTVNGSCRRSWWSHGAGEGDVTTFSLSHAHTRSVSVEGRGVCLQVVHLTSMMMIRGVCSVCVDTVVQF